MSDTLNSLWDIEENIQKAEQINASTAREVVDATLSRERSEVRAHATRIIIWIYAAVLGLCVLFIMGSGVVSTDFKTAVAELTDLIKTALIPIVTFVIGHYFGSSSR